MSKHTATPWHIPTAPGTVGAIAHSNGYIGFTCIPRSVNETRSEGESWMAMRDRTQQERDAIEAEQVANREFIVRACNAHDELVKALQQLLPRMAPAYKGTSFERDALAALAKAGAA